MCCWQLGPAKMCDSHKKYHRFHRAQREFLISIELNITIYTMPLIGAVMSCLIFDI